LVVKGYDIREAENGADALELMRSENLDLILVDWVMSGMDGLELCRAIRAASDVPIIMVTSKQDGRADALAAGANNYVRKPFSVNELLMHIESALTHSRHRLSGN
jgi:DNA-binding response OmpR family regulator